MGFARKSDMPPRYSAAKLAKKLDRDSRVLVWLERNAETNDGSADALFHALANPTESGWVDRAVAFHILGSIDLSPMEQEHAMRLVRDAFKRPDMGKVTILRFGGLLGTSVLSWAALSFLYSMVVREPFGFPELSGGLMTGLLLTPLVLALQERNRTLLTRRIAAAALIRLGDPNCIMALYEHVRRPSIVMQDAVQALKAVLPRMTSDWYGRLPSGVGPALENMARSSDTELAIAALDALGQAGQGSSARAVERIAAHAAASHVRERAALVLRILIARQEHDKAVTTLLRPSDGGTPGELLRPVSGSDPTVRNLLRASNSQSLDTILEDDKS